MRNYILLISVISLLLGCTKSLEIDIIESRCKDFQISDASNTFENPNCPGDIKENTINVSFNTSGVNECLKSLHRTVVFYNQQNEKITAFTQDPDSINVEDPTFIIGSNTASFEFKFEMASIADYDNISYATINFYTQNETLNQSNKLAVISSFPCQGIPDPSSYDRTITVRDSSNLSVTLYDNASEDGDIITIIINNEIAQENIVIYNTPQIFNFSIEGSAQNHISFYAVNEGTSSPNTVSGSISDGYTNQSFDVNMNEGETISFNLVYQGQ